MCRPDFAFKMRATIGLSVILAIFVQTLQINRTKEYIVFEHTVPGNDYNGTKCQEFISMQLSEYMSVYMSSVVKSTQSSVAIISSIAEALPSADLLEAMPLVLERIGYSMIDQNKDILEISISYSSNSDVSAPRSQPLSLVLWRGEHLVHVQKSWNSKCNVQTSCTDGQPCNGQSSLSCETAVLDNQRSTYYEYNTSYNSNMELKALNWDFVCDGVEENKVLLAALTVPITIPSMMDKVPTKIMR